MAVHRHRDFVFVGKGRDAFGRAHGRRSSDEFDAERLRHLEAALDLFIREAVTEAVVVGLQLDARRVELLANVFEVIERNGQAPLARLFTLLAHRFAHFGRHLTASATAGRRALWWCAACGSATAGRGLWRSSAALWARLDV